MIFTLNNFKLAKKSLESNGWMKLEKCFPTFRDQLPSYMRNIGVKCVVTLCKHKNIGNIFRFWIEMNKCKTNGIYAGDRVKVIKFW